MSEIFHIVGMCPDSFAHPDFLDLLTVSSVELFYAYQATYFRFFSWFKKK